jgi:hypothetical protein
MLSRSFLIALGIATFVAVAIMRFPAAVAYRWFAPPDVSLAAVAGTVWQGHAAQGAVGGIAFSDLSWRLSPLELLTGKLALIVDEVRIGTGSARAQLTASGSEADITVVDLLMDLEPFSDVLALGDVRGQVSAREMHVRIVDGWPVAAQGQIRINGLAVPPLIPMAGVQRVLLGNFRAEFTPSDTPGIVTLISDEGGPLELTGSFRLTPDRMFEFDTRIRPRADASDVLVQGLELVSGAPDAEGRRSFRQTGSL